MSEKKKTVTPKALPSGQGGYTSHGLAKPDDPIYTTGPVVQGRPILKPPKKKGGHA